MVADIFSCFVHSYLQDLEPHLAQEVTQVRFIEYMDERIKTVNNQNANEGCVVGKALVDNLKPT